MGAAVFLRSLDGSFVWVFWLIVPIGAVSPAEETRLQGVTVDVLTMPLTAAKSLSRAEASSVSSER